MSATGILGWKIWYEDASTFSSKEGDWTKAPSGGVQIVVVYYAGGLKINHSGFDYYWLQNGVLRRITTDLGYDFELGGVPMAAVKKGSLLNDNIFKKIQDRVARDKEKFP